MTGSSEVWRFIPFAPQYEASSDGRIRRGGCLLATRVKGGYVDFTASIGMKRCAVRVHRAVAAAFLGPRPAGMQICHWDGCPTNNAVSNLRYGSPAENWEDRRRHGNSNDGERNGRAKLTRADVDAIRRSSDPARVIAAKYLIGRRYVSDIRRGVRWSAE